MAYWLYVNGDGSWTFANKFYRSGPHEVPEETYAAALERSHDDVWLFVADERPTVPRRRPLDGALTATDLAHGTEDTKSRELYEAVLAEAAAKKATTIFERPETPAVKPGRIPCPAKSCEKDYASAEPLARHLAAKHPELVMAEVT